MKTTVLQCKLCKHEWVIEINPKDLADWRAGKKIQNAMPYLSLDERELLISGICGNCFDDMFKEEDE